MADWEYREQLRRCNTCGIAFYADEPWKKRCLACWKRSKGVHSKWQEPIRPTFHSAPPPAIEEEMLRRLIFLCHPDKHNNSQAAKLATEWLLRQRK